MITFMASFSFVAIFAIAIWLYAVTKAVDNAKLVIGHMLLGNITGASIDEDGEVEIEYKEAE